MKDESGSRDDRTQMSRDNVFNSMELEDTITPAMNSNFGQQLQQM